MAQYHVEAAYSGLDRTKIVRRALIGWWYPLKLITTGNTTMAISIKFYFSLYVVINNCLFLAFHQLLLW